MKTFHRFLFIIIFHSDNTERVTGRKARGLQMEERGCKCQTFLSLLSSRRKKKEVSLKMLCCQDTWFHLKLTTLKPWVNQYISFSYGNVVLSCVNVPQTLSPSPFCQMAQPTYSGIVPLIYVNETICWYSTLLQDSNQSFYGQGWIIWCHSKFYDIPLFSLTDCEWLYNTQLKRRRGVLFCPLLMPMSEAFSISFIL